MAQSVTLSSVGTAAIVLNPVAKATTVQLTVTSASTGTWGTTTVEFSLDDPTQTPAPTSTWTALSSALAIASSQINAAGGLVWTVLSPINQVRINSTANSTSTTTLTVNVLKALQSVTA